MGSWYGFNNTWGLGFDNIQIIEADMNLMKLSKYPHGPSLPDPSQLVQLAGLGLFHGQLNWVLNTLFFFFS